MQWGLRRGAFSLAISRGPRIASQSGMLSDPHGTNPLTKTIIGCAIAVHRVIGPGAFENVYAECFAYELHENGVAFETERLVPLIYKGATLKAKYYVDFVVENRVIVELKAVTEVAKIHESQVLTQLKLTGLPVGLLINFNVPVLADGVTRLVNPLLPVPPNAHGRGR
jgi:GxxExxY protein